jgi:hypothetical protein
MCPFVVTLFLILNILVVDSRFNTWSCAVKAPEFAMDCSR